MGLFKALLGLQDREVWVVKVVCHSGLGLKHVQSVHRPIHILSQFAGMSFRLNLFYSYRTPAYRPTHPLSNGIPDENTFHGLRSHRNPFLNAENLMSNRDKATNCKANSIV